MRVIKNWIRSFISLGVLGSIWISIISVEASEDCSKVFTESDVDYSQYLPSVVRIQSYGYKILTEDRIMEVLNFMNQDIESSYLVSSIVDRLIELKNSSSRDYKKAIAAFQFLLMFYNVGDIEAELFAQELNIDKTNILNIRQMFEIINNDLGSASKTCSAAIISHNMLLTAAHCVQQKKIVKLRLEDGRTLSSFNIFTSVASIASARKFNYDVAIVIFDDHSFDGFTPLKLASSSPSTIEGAVIGIDQEGKKDYLNIKADHQGLMFCSYCDDSEEQLSFGYSGGPLIDQTGQILGVTSSSVRYKGQNSIDVFSDVSRGYNRDYLEEVVKEQGFSIDGTR